MCSLQRFLPAVGPCAHTNKPADVRTDTYTAGLPVSGDLGWTSEAPHGFHIPTSSSIWTGFQLIPLYLFPPLLSLHTFVFSFHISFLSSYFYRSWTVTKPVGVPPPPPPFPPVTTISGQWCQSAGSQHLDLSKWSGLQTWSWIAVALSWLNPQHVWMELHPVEEKPLRQQRFLRILDQNRSGCFLEPLKYSLKNLDLRANLPLSSNTSVVEETFEVKQDAS